MRFAIFYRKHDAWSDGGLRENALGAQRVFMTDAAEGCFVLAFGYLEGAEALAFVECPSRLQAEEFAGRDPAVVAGVYSAVLRGFESGSQL